MAAAYLRAACLPPTACSPGRSRSCRRRWQETAGLDAAAWFNDRCSAPAYSLQVVFDEPRRLRFGLAVLTRDLLAFVLFLDVDKHEADTDDEHDVRDVEHRPLVRLVLPQDEVGHDAVIDAVDQVTDGAAGDERERPVQDALIG